MLLEGSTLLDQKPIRFFTFLAPLNITVRDFLDSRSVCCLPMEEQ